MPTANRSPAGRFIGATARFKPSPAAPRRRRTSIRSAGSITIANGVFTVRGSHTYDEGHYLVSVTVSHDSSIPVTVTSSASAGDAPLTAAGINISALSGLAFNDVLAVFQDANPHAPA